ncbi:hypothetical protein NL676_007125 [Syzygium grande]|nr:hypothetical protein NL676_007125 [Syzygium grande]
MLGDVGITTKMAMGSDGGVEGNNDGIDASQSAKMRGGAGIGAMAATTVSNDSSDHQRAWRERQHDPVVAAAVAGSTIRRV